MKENNELKRNKPVSMLTVIGIGCSIASVIYAIFNRSGQDFIKYSFYISGTTGLILLSIGIFYSFKNGIRKLKAEDFVLVIAIFIILLIIGPSYYAFGVVIKDLYLWLQSLWFQFPEITIEWAMPIVVGIVIIVGFLLFYFRLRARSFYGLTEAMVGLSIAMQKVSSENPQELTKSSFYIAILTASIYLFVRGLDNIHQGISKDPYDYYAFKIYNYLRKDKETIN